MILVTGLAPRSGTSAMMRALTKIYKTHSCIEQYPSWTAREMNPNGFWDICLEQRDGDEPIVTEEHTVLKLWSPQFHRVDPEAVDLIVQMTRSDFIGQVNSIVKTAKAQGLPELTPQHISHMFLNQRECLEKYFPYVDRLIVPMEEFRLSPDKFLRQIKEAIPWQ